MKYHYLPKYNESEFNRIANEADPILLERRKRKMCTEIVKHRNAILRELSDLRYKPRRTLDEDQRMEEIEKEAKRLMRVIGEIASHNSKSARYCAGSGRIAHAIGPKKN